MENAIILYFVVFVFVFAESVFVFGFGFEFEFGDLFAESVLEFGVEAVAIEVGEFEAEIEIVVVGAVASCF
jgi:hypothetical protein